MDKEITEQTKIINDLRTLGASHSTIAYEEQRLQELQAIYYKYFRRDMIQVLCYIFWCIYNEFRLFRI